MEIFWIELLTILLLYGKKSTQEHFYLRLRLEKSSHVVSHYAFLCKNEQFFHFLKTLHVIVKFQTTFRR